MATAWTRISNPVTAWTRISNSVTTWTKLSTGGWFKSRWFYDWFGTMRSSYWLTSWTKISNP